MYTNDSLWRKIAAKVMRQSSQAVFEEYEIVIDEEFYIADFVIEGDVQKGSGASWNENTGGTPAEPTGAIDERIKILKISWYNNATKEFVEIPKGDQIWTSAERTIDHMLEDSKFQEEVDEKFSSSLEKPEKEYDPNANL